ncbi:EamA family transporter [Candidatus Woesearchaeota archaeon]|nr:EamA family transporter [Candidatus Woesearchaeota archaeon]
MVLGSFLGAWGMFLVKRAAHGMTFKEMLQKGDLWWGLILTGVSTIVYMMVLRQVELSVAYPFAALTYLWTTGFSVKYLGEKMNRWKWLGLAGIMVGVSLIGLGS